MTVADLLERYAADAALRISPDTRYQHAVVYRAVCRDFGELPVHALTPDHLRQWRDLLLECYAPGTVRRWLDTLSSALNAAVRDYEVLTRNPMHGVRKPRESQGRERFLSDEERTALLTACRRSRNPGLYPIVFLALATGARKNELRRLRWRDVDLERGMVRLPQTKTGERRGVALAQVATQALQAWRASQPPGRVWVFPGMDGQRPGTWTRAWATARRQAGLEDFRFHDLRHTAASYLCMSGASLVEVAHILGHKTMRMVQRYSHFTEAHTRGTLERMAQHFLRPED